MLMMGNTSSLSLTRHSNDIFYRTLSILMKIMMCTVACYGSKLILAIFILLFSSLDAHPISQRHELLKRNPTECKIQPYDVKCHGICPTGVDKEAKANYTNCANGTRYHCNKKKDTTEYVEVCAVPIKCDKGKEPVILVSDNNIGAIICEDCKNGTFNKIERLSDSYPQCERKKKCTGKGEMKCEEPPGTELWTDSGCTCDYAKGWHPLSNEQTCNPNVPVTCSDDPRCEITEEYISNFTCVPKCPADSYRSKDECIRISKTDTDKTINITLSPTTTLPVTVLPASISTTITSTFLTESTTNSDRNNAGVNGKEVIGIIIGFIVGAPVMYCFIGILIYKYRKWKIGLCPNRESVWFWPCKVYKSCRGDHASKSVFVDRDSESSRGDHNSESGDGTSENDDLLQSEVSDESRDEVCVDHDSESSRGDHDSESVCVDHDSESSRGNADSESVSSESTNHLNESEELTIDEQKRVLNKCIRAIKTQMGPKHMLDYFRSQELFNEYAYIEIADHISNKGTLDANDKIVEIVRKNNCYYKFKKGLKKVGHDSLIKVLEEKEQQVLAESREKAKRGLTPTNDGNKTARPTKTITKPPAESMNNDNPIVIHRAWQPGDSAGGDGQHGDLAGGDGQHGDLAGGDGQHGDLAGGDGQHRDLADGDGQHGDLAGGDGQHGDLASGDGQHGDLAGGDGQHGDVAGGDGQHGDLAGGDGQHGDLAGGDGQHGDLADGDGQHGDLADGDGQHGDSDGNEQSTSVPMSSTDINDL